MGDEKIKLGVLFSQSGPMAVTESAHIQGALLACEEINAAGGIDGRPIDPIVMDPKGNDRRYAEMAADLILNHRANCIIGGCLSASRKAVLPVIERFNGVLFYPSVYEGFEYSPNVIYGGAVPNQAIIPLLEYIFTYYGKNISLLGSNTLYAREVNRIVKEFLRESGGTVIYEHYVEFGATPETILPEVRKIRAKQPDAVISTVVGEDTVHLYACYADVFDAEDAPPIASLTTTESELSKMTEDTRAGHLAVSPYFGSLSNSSNQVFANAYKKRFPNAGEPGVYSEVTYALVNFFANATALSGKGDSDSILSALSGAVFKSPGGDLSIDLETNHFTLRPMIGVSNTAGGYDVVWRSPTPIRPDPYLVSYDRTVTDRGNA